MGTKTAVDTSNLNLLAKIANMAGVSALGVSEELAEKLIKQSDKSTKFMNQGGWHTFCDGLVPKFCDQDTADSLKQFVDYPFPWGGILMVMAILKVKMTDLESVMNIYGLDRQYSDQEKTTPHPAPLDNLVRAMMIDPARSSENKAQLKRLGYSDLQVSNIILSYYRTVEEGVIRTNYLRGNITSEILYERMRELGYTDTRTAEIIQTWSVIPGPGDLFHLVAKEAFEPDTIALLGLGAEFPTDMLPSLAANGYSEEWAKRFWYAHWDQPSIGQGFEMLHRGVIDFPMLDTLFKTVEIPPFWRDKLTKIAYSPYTRVDVRRMHDIGVITDVTKLTRAYMDLGYDPEKAGEMTKFTVKYNDRNNKDLSKAAILSAYEDGLMSETDTRAMLANEEYPTDLIDWYILMSDFKVQQVAVNLEKENIRDEFLLSNITSTTAKSRLEAVGVVSSVIGPLIDSWKLDLFKYESIPTKSELDRFLMSGIIDEGAYINYMSRHGFTPHVIGYYLSEIKSEQYDGKQPSRTDLKEMYKKNAITIDEWTQEMKLLNYSDINISRYLKSM